MRHLSLLLLYLLFLAGCSPKTTAVATQADNAASPLPQAPAAAHEPGINDTTLLWKITSPGAEQSSYLFGTIHLIPEDKYFMPNKVVAALNASDEVIFEIDPRDMQNPAKMMGLINKINMIGGVKLGDLLSAEDYATVKGYFADSQLPFMFLERMKPLFVSAMVGQDGGVMGGFGGMSGMKSYEMELTDIAEAAGKSIGGLETMEFQMSLFDSIAYEDQANMLLEAVKADVSKSETGEDNQLDQMVDMYRRQAVAEMATMMSEESMSVGRFEDLLLTRRNENWAPIIQTASVEKPMFYAVGAGHLGGVNGVISLLRQSGVTVEPVF